MNRRDHTMLYAASPEVGQPFARLLNRALEIPSLLTMFFPALLPAYAVNVFYMIRTTSFIFLLTAGLFLSSSPTNAQSVDDLSADEFPRTRNITKGIERGDTAFVFKPGAKPAYKHKRSSAKPKPRGSKPQSAVSKTLGINQKLPNDPKSAEIWKSIGVTLWKLIPEKRADNIGSDAARILVQESGESVAYVPKRVAADTAFKQGDKVRLSFESPGTGYIYIIDREVYADGSVGEPYLVFPTMSARGGDNKLQPGRVIEIPAQTDRIPFFTLRSDKPNWRGEMLTVVVSPIPLEAIKIPAGPSPIARERVELLEDKYLRETKEFELVGGEGKNYTIAEKEAVGTTTRQLTQNDPFPQNVLRAKSRPKEPMLVNFQILVAN